MDINILSTMEEDLSEEQLVLAALLHDIGKFFQRTKIPHDSSYNPIKSDIFGWSGAHAKWSADFIVNSLHRPDLEDLVLFHHNPTKSGHPQASRIIQKADHISSAMDRIKRDSDELGDVDKEPLKSIFTTLTLDTDPVPDRYLLPRCLSLTEDFFPGGKEERYSTILSTAYMKIWKEFLAELEKVDSPYSVTTLVYLLKKYTSRIPSAVYKHEPDIPLYDHATTTAAIALCLARAKGQTPFLLIQGDLSGIQGFIFNVSNPQGSRKRMAKRLRGRSFWLELLMDAVATEIAQDLDLFKPNILWNTGGNFMILAPNTPGAVDQISALRRRINQAMLDHFDGRLYLALDTLPCGEADIQDFAATRDRLNLQLTAQKRRKFSECNIPFISCGKPSSIEDHCPVCGHLLHAWGEEKCKLCTDHELLGDRLARARYLVRGVGYTFHFKGFGLAATYDFIDHPPAPSAGVSLFRINDLDFLVPGIRESGFLFIGNTVPLDQHTGEILNFSDLAQIAKGDKKLGVLKADVDNLGQLFTIGFSSPQRSISRIHTLSSEMQLFFGGYLNTICKDFVVYSDLCPKCRTNARRIELYEDDDRFGERILYDGNKVCDTCKKRFAVSKVYIIYSGGDDLLIVGPYDAILELAERIESDFRQFVCKNPAVTLSAGIAVVHARHPIARTVPAAEEQLNRAKKTDKKNRIAVFEECVPWRAIDYEKDYASLLAAGRRLETAVETRAISKGFVYTLLELWEDTFGDTLNQPHKRQYDARIRRKRFLPYLKYMIVRNVKTDHREIETLLVSNFPWIRFPAIWAGMRLRK